MRAFIAATAMATAASLQAGSVLDLGSRLEPFFDLHGDR